MQDCIHETTEIARQGQTSPCLDQPENSTETSMTSIPEEPSMPPSSSATLEYSSFPQEMVVLLSNEEQIMDGGIVVSAMIEEGDDPVRCFGGPDNKLYHLIQSQDAFLELYEKIEVDNNTLYDSSSDGLGSLVWSFGRVPFSGGNSFTELGYDCNLANYVFFDGPEGKNFYGKASAVKGYILDRIEKESSRCFLAWIPSENKAAIFWGSWENSGSQLWNSNIPPSYFPYKAEEYRTLIPTARISGALSITGSFLILYMIIGHWIHHKQFTGTKDRILVGLTIMDILFSFALAISTAATPKESYGVVGAVGNTATCDAQGFMFQLGIGVPLYFFGLSLVFLLYVRNQKNVKFVASRVEPVIHLTVWLFTLSAAISGLVLGFFNSNGQFCYIEPYPYDCELDLIAPSCTRGGGSGIYVWILAAAVVGISYFGILIVMGMLYYSVWDQDRKLRSRYGELWNGNMDRLREVRRQAFLYVGGFFLTWLWTGIRLLFEWLGRESNLWLVVFATATLPLQGFFNFLVFVRGPYQLVRKEHPDKHFFWILVISVFLYPWSRISSAGMSRRRRSSIKRDSRLHLERSSFSSLDGLGYDHEFKSKKNGSGELCSATIFTSGKVSVDGQSTDQIAKC